MSGQEMTYDRVGEGWDRGNGKFRPDVVGLSLNALRGANVARLPTFKNSKGEPAHSEPDGSDWALSTWSNAVLGELGEAANLIKKVERGDISLEDARPELAKEFADVLTYLDILAFRAGVLLGQATVEKFNEVSRGVGSPVRLSASTWEAPGNGAGGPAA